MSAPLYLVDGSGYIYRAYYAIRPLSNRAGVPTNAVFGFARMLIKLLRDKKPSLLGIAFDTKEPNFRHAIYEDYKATRDAVPEDLEPQFELIHELVLAMDIPLLVHPRFEADDLIATLTRQALESGREVVVVSGDKDLMQLVGEHVRMYDPMKDVEYDRAGVVERFGVQPELVADVLALTGDASDNIPGVPKVGAKTAAKLVAAHGDVEQVIAALTSLPKRKAVEESVVQNTELARLSKRLTVLDAHAPVALELDKLAYTKPRADKLEPFLRKIDATQLLRDLGLAGGGPLGPSVAEVFDEAPTADEPELFAVRDDVPEAAASAVPLAPTAPGLATPIDRSTYRAVFTAAELDAELEAARAARRMAFDTETTSLDANRAELVGVALAVPGRPAIYVPVAHRYLGVPKQLAAHDVVARLKPVLEDASIAKVGQNLKYDWVVLARLGVLMRGITEDTMLAAYLLDPSRLSFSLDTLAREVLGHETIRYDDVTGTGKSRINFEAVAVERATEYAAEDADVALRLADVLRERVREAGLTDLYTTLEVPLLSLLARMERTGVLIDPTHLQRLGTELSHRLVAVEQKAQALIGEPINLSSPKQLGELFFVKLKYPVLKKTRTGFSTDSDVLEQLARDYELPRVVLEHRVLAKLKGTYVDALPRLVNPETGRVHTSFNQTGTATGRLSSSDPNLQNIPIRTEDGRRIRAAFTAQPGWEIVSADYSQIELRIMAHLSGDADFIDAFRRGEDIHARTAREILGGDAAPDARRKAKAINFGILYGLSEFGLAQQLGIPRGEAAAYIKAYFARYPKIRGFLDRSIDEARERGFTSTLLGRRRFLPELSSRNRNLRMRAERIAMNTPIQGSAADIIKLAMLRVAAALEEQKLAARLILQVHDELVLESPEGERERVVELVRRAMSEVMQLAVPLDVEVGHGANWAEAH